MVSAARSSPKVYGPSQLLDAPAALTTDGKLRVGVTHVTGEQVDPQKALSRALKSGRRVFLALK